MTRYRIIEAPTKGYYIVQRWEPPKWWRKGRWEVLSRWSSGNLACELSLSTANCFLDQLLYAEKKAEEQKEYENKDKIVVREEEVK